MTFMQIRNDLVNDGECFSTHIMVFVFHFHRSIVTPTQCVV